MNLLNTDRNKAEFGVCKYTDSAFKNVCLNQNQQMQTDKVQ